MKHSHKVRRRNLGRKKDYIVYACVLPNCSYYVVPDLILGKEVICWSCGKPFIMTYGRLIAKPTCCTNKRFNADQIIKGQPEFKQELDDIFKMLKEEKNEG